jgi:hypothetical protein
MRFLLPALLAALAGCVSAPEGSSGSNVPPGTIVELHIMTAPVGINMDAQAGADGFSVRVFANDATHPKPVRMSNGQLEILMFNGTFFGRTNVPPPLKVWTFSAAELRGHEFTARIGTGYNFTLAWGAARPSERMISVAARYTGPDGAVITSRPSSVAVIEK